MNQNYYDGWMVACTAGIAFATMANAAMIYIAAREAKRAATNFGAEALARRKIELAEDILAIAEEARAIFNYITRSLRFIDGDKKWYEEYWDGVVEQNEFFSKVNSVKYRAGVYFGDVVREGLDVYLVERNGLFASLRMLSAHYRDDVSGSKMDADSYAEHYNHVWNRDNQVTRKIDLASDNINDVLRAFIASPSHGG